jgi:hypothetical protein
MSDVADELYALPPHSFTEARNARVAEAKNAGERDRAAALGALKRPTVGAWLVNLVALRRSDALADLVATGQRLRTAQDGVTPGGEAGRRIRELAEQRRVAIEAVLATVRALVADAGEPEPSAAQLAEAESTFAAAMADDDAAEQARSGRLLKPLSYSGFGSFGFGSPDLWSPGPGGGPPAPGRSTAAGRSTAPGDDASAEAALAERQAAAQARVDEARASMDRAVAAERAAAAEVQRLTDELDRIRERVDQARASAQSARQARLAAERDLGSAERRLAKLSAP